MPPPLSISLALQPPSCHSVLSLSSSSRSRCSSLNPTHPSSSSAPLSTRHQHATAPSLHSTDTPLFLVSGTTTTSSPALVRSPLARSVSCTTNLSSLTTSLSSTIVIPSSQPTITTASKENIASDPSSVIWKAYSRVKQTIADNQPKSLETMSEYWHSLSSPRPQDLLLQETTTRTLGVDISSSSSSSSPSSPSSSSLSSSLSSSSSLTTISSNTSDKNSLPSPISELDSDSNACKSPCSANIKPSLSLSSPTSVSRATEIPTTTTASTAPLSSATLSCPSSSNSVTSTSTQATSTTSRISLPTQAYNYYTASTLQTTTLVRSASEQGRLLAQRSKTSLNRLLDTVMDNATSLAESSAAHESYSEGDEDEKLRVKKIAISSPTAAAAASATATHRPVLQRQNTSRATFFVCEDSDEDEDEAEAAEESLFRSRIALARRNNSNTNIKHQPCQQVQKSQLPLKFYVEDEEDELDGADGDNEHEEDQDEEEEEEESYFSLKVSEFVPVVDRRRKLSSLLSDLLMAEKQLQLQQLSITSTSGPTSTTIRTTRNSTDMDCSSCLSNHESVPGSPCPSTTNSDGEMAIHQNDQRLFRTSSSPKHLDNLQQEPNRVSPPPSSAYALITENQKPKSPLVRTKRVFKNLDELAIITAATNNNSNATASTTPSTNCTVSSPIPLPSPLSPTASFKAPATTNTNTTTTKAAAPNPSAGWTRASLQVPQQVHVQIQNLVVQSTSTAHRAFRSASSTLNEVLFRTAK